MRVLMFGWEFPPHISGGLGTACYGMVRGLANNDSERPATAWSEAWPTMMWMFFS